MTQHLDVTFSPTIDSNAQQANRKGNKSESKREGNATQVER